MIHTEDRSQDLFESGEAGLAASNGKFYTCLEHYGQAIKLDGKLVCGVVKLANPPKRVEFFELPFMNEQELDEYLANPDSTVAYQNTRHLYYRIKEMLPEVTAHFSKGRIYCNGYKIAWQKLGYEMYDRYRKRIINQFEDNSDFWNSDLVLPLLDDAPTDERMEAIRESAEKVRKTVFLRSHDDYKRYIAGKSDKPSLVIKTESNAGDPREIFMDDVRDFLDGLLEEKKVRIRFKKRTKHFEDSGKRLINFLALTAKVQRKAVTRKDYLQAVEELLY